MMEKYDYDDCCVDDCEQCTLEECEMENDEHQF